MKKIFALVLSLCLVLSTFVAVSAQEQVWNEGVWNEGTPSIPAKAYVNIEKNFDAADATMKNGNGMPNATVTADPTGTRTGTVYGGACDGTSTGYMGFEIAGVDGNVITSLNAGDVVTLSVDVYTSAEFKAGNNAFNGATNGILLRTNKWVPSSDWYQVVPNGTVFTAGEWTTVETTFTVPTTIGTSGVCFQIRPNVVTDLYIDNLKLKIETPVKYVEYTTNIDDNLDSASGLTHVAGTTVTPASIGGRDGVLKVTGVADGNGTVAGMKIGDNYSFKAGDVIGYSVDIYSASGMTPNLWLRNQKGGMEPFNGSFKPAGVTVPAGQWTTISYEVPFESLGGTTSAEKSPDGWATVGNYALYFRGDGMGEFYIDNFKVYVYNEVADEDVVLPGWEVEQGWGPVDFAVPFVLAPKNVAGTLEDGVYTVTSEQLKAYAGATTDFSNCSANDWLKITPETTLDATKTIKVSFDIKAENLVNSVGDAYANRTLALRIRNASNGNVVAWNTYTCTVPVNTGKAEKAEYIINVADIAGVDHFGVNVDMQNPLRYGDGTEYFEISNVAITEVGTKVDLSVEEGADSVTLTLSNANAEAYKVIGNLFVATYNNEKQMQLFGYEQVSKEIEAGDNATVTVTLPGTIGADDAVKVFFWEADGSLTTIADWTL